MPDRRVVITGMGTVNAVTTGGTAAVESALARGPSAIGAVTGLSIGGLPSRLGAQVDPDRLASLIGLDAARRLSRICQLTVAACELAVKDAAAGAGPELGIVVGTEHGDFRSSAEFALGFLRRGPTGLSPMIFPNTVMNTMASVAAIAIGAKGPSVTLNQTTVAGDLAVARGAALVASGRADAVVAGGVDEICEPTYRHLAGMGALSPALGDGPEACRPFDPAHNGPVLGEGATFAVLESLEAARARGATIIAELGVGRWASAGAAPHAVSRRAPDARSSVSRLLRTHAREMSACYGSGNGDPAVDDWELALLASDLADAPPGLVPPVSLAPVFGQHGGLGALRAAVAALAARTGGGCVLAHGIARGGCRTALIMRAMAE